MKRINRLILFIGICILFLSFPVLTLADEATINNIIITNDDISLIVYAELQGAFTLDIMEVVDSGVPVNFTFHFALMRKRGIWFDEELDSKTIIHSVKYDLLKKQYNIELIDNENKESLDTLYIQDMKTIMSELNDIKIGHMQNLLPSEEYYIQIKAEMMTIEWPFPLNYLLSFISFWDFETSWISSETIKISGKQYKHEHE